MVDVPSVTNLTDTPAAWDNVPRLEDGWWPTGGAVDPENDNGLMNWQPQILARRTRFLRNMIEGAGIGVDVGPLVTSFNAVTLGGSYRAAAGATGAPIGSGAFTFLHQPGASTAEATQHAVHVASSRAFFRRRTAGVWQGWVEVWAGVEATSTIANPVFQRLPSGLIMQWGRLATGTTNATVVAFTTTFPNNLLALSLGDLNNGAAPTGAHIISYRDPTNSGFTVAMYLHDGTIATSSGFDYVAIGH